MAWRIINTSPAHHLGTIARRRALYNTRCFTTISPLLSSSYSNDEQQNDNNELLETKLRQLAKIWNLDRGALKS